MFDVFPLGFRQMHYVNRTNDSVYPIFISRLLAKQLNGMWKVHKLVQCSHLMTSFALNQILRVCLLLLFGVC